jgi:enterobactin synthetase component D
MDLSDLPPGMGASTFLRALSRFELPFGEGLSCRFDAQAYHDDLFAHYGVTKPAAMDSAALSRRAEYLAGRLLCRELLRRHDLPDQVATGPHREPIWPHGWIGSISHSDGLAVAALAPAAPDQILGLDLAPWLPPMQWVEIESLVALPGELDALTAEWSPASLLTLVFSAKESLFKALYPHVGHYFDFTRAKVTGLDEGPQRAGAFVIELQSDLASTFCAGACFMGNWRLFGDQLLTVIAQRV